VPSIGALIVVRVCTGAATAGVIPVALAYLSDAVPYAERQAALGRVVSVAAFGGIISAALGGVIAALVSWRALFIGYGALAVLVAVVLLRLPVRRVRPPGYHRAGILAPYRVIAVEGGAAPPHSMAWSASRGSRPAARSATSARCSSPAINSRTA